jgi:hypothetical protein
MQLELWMVGMRVLVDVVDPLGVEQRRAPLDAVDLVALFKQEFREIGPVLACDAHIEWTRAPAPDCPSHISLLDVLQVTVYGIHLRIFEGFCDLAKDVGCCVQVIRMKETDDIAGSTGDPLVQGIVDSAVRFTC